jgi:hypothetical protein
VKRFIQKIILLGGGFGRRLEADGVIRAVQIAQHVDGHPALPLSAVLDGRLCNQ